MVGNSIESQKETVSIYNNLKSRDFGLWSPVLFSLWREEPMTSDGWTIKDALGDSEWYQCWERKLCDKNALKESFGCVNSGFCKRKKQTAKMCSSPQKMQEREQRATKSPLSSLSALFLSLTYTLYFPLQHYWHTHIVTHRHQGRCIRHSHSPTNTAHSILPSERLCCECVKLYQGVKM